MNRHLQRIGELPKTEGTCLSHFKCAQSMPSILSAMSLVPCKHHSTARQHALGVPDLILPRVDESFRLSLYIDLFGESVITAYNFKSATDSPKLSTILEKEGSTDSKDRGLLVDTIFEEFSNDHASSLDENIDKNRFIWALTVWAGYLNTGFEHPLQSKNVWFSVKVSEWLSAEREYLTEMTTSGAPIPT